MKFAGDGMSDRCTWVGQDPIYLEYHDVEWGVPEYDSRALFEKLCLDGFQAGLSWLTILKKRDNFRRVFQGFDPNLIAEWGEEQVTAALADSGIVRHRGKIEAMIGNARGWQSIEQQGGFDTFLWDRVGGLPVQNQFRLQSDVPTQDALSADISKQLKSHGFRFVGPTIVYAFMEASGFFNNHMVTCPRHSEIAAMGR